MVFLPPSAAFRGASATGWRWFWGMFTAVFGVFAGVILVNGGSPGGLLLTGLGTLVCGFFWVFLGAPARSGPRGRWWPLTYLASCLLWLPVVVASGQDTEASLWPFVAALLALLGLRAAIGVLCRSER
ncbi:MAG: hypothetical protein QM621_07150 [Aeromicrobium sp.]|uniref:hypothetical protein n=1 Tax=Aeromicrobium sp. TaxID=1871063 RepID=UPI0039E65FFF